MKGIVSRLFKNFIAKRLYTHSELINDIDKLLFIDYIIIVDLNYLVLYQYRL